MNSLSINPTDSRWADKLADWQDGQEYDVTLHVRQTAPGEFDVTSLEETETPAEEAAPAEESDAGGNMGGGAPMGGKMPAVAVVIARGKSK